MALSKKKTPYELKQAKIKRIKNKRKAGHKKRSLIAKRAAQRMSKTLRNRRGRRAAITRKRLYG